MCGTKAHSDLRDYAAGVYLSDIYVWRMTKAITLFRIEFTNGNIIINDVPLMLGKRCRGWHNNIYCISSYPWFNASPPSALLAQH